MALTYSTTNIQSNVLAYEMSEPRGFCREQLVVDNTGATMQLGSVLYRTVNEAASLTVYGAWTEVADTDLADIATTFAPTATTHVEFAVIIGTNALGEALDTSQVDIGTTATEKVLALVRGRALVRKQGLKYTGTASAGADANLVEAIELNMEQVLVVEAQDAFDGTYSDVTPIT